ncbi:MAG TPA: CHAT domain-containing protein, partial [bacterium]|nr:CHAT domain-containing protein [bacterium]
AGALEAEWIPLRITLETAARAPALRRREFLARTTADAGRAVAELRRAIWEPLCLRDANVVVIPERELHDVPLEALGAGAVSRLPHPALLAPSRLPAGRDALVLTGSGPGARRETDDVAAILRDGGWNVRTGDRRAALAESGPLALLHVAAHGVFHRQAWLLSGLHVRDGWIGFEQLRRRQLRGALLQFTSCESGLAEILPGSEIDGWIAAGLGAGARELVLTLWKVDDASTRAFTRSFYRHWTAGTPAPAAAAAARREVRRKTPHPYSWAPFCAVG